MAEDSPKTTISQAKAEGERVAVTWGDGHRSLFHAAWLRHAIDTNRPDGMNGVSRRTLRQAAGADRIGGVAVTPEGDLEVTWQPGPSATRHQAAWLRAHCYSAEERARRRRPLKLWDATLAGHLPRSDYDAVCTDEQARLALFEQVLDRGFAFLRGVPPQSGSVLDAAALFGLVSPTPYADDPGEPRLENIRVDHRVPVNTRKSDFLGPHTDTCWRASLSGLVYLHCLVAHGGGGETILVDGFSVGERLRAEAPESFATLSEVPLNFASKVSNGDDWRARGRILSLGPDGEVCGLRYNAPSVHQLDLPEALIEPVLAALEAFERVLYDETQWLKLKLSPGDLLVLDNQRVMHGRTAFDPDAGERLLQTCSTRRDEFHNRYRHLARHCGREDWNRELSWGVI